MEDRILSTIFFYDEDKKILLQGRKSISKFGEEWGPFGGSVEPGEFHKDAIVREVKEELNYDLKDFRLLNHYNQYVENLDGSRIHLFESVYVSVFPGFDRISVMEGDSACLFRIDNARKLKVQSLYLKIFDDLEDCIKP